MSISEKTGKVAGKLVTGLMKAPRATGGKFKQIGQDLSKGYREVVPQKETD